MSMPDPDKRLQDLVGILVESSQDVDVGVGENGEETKTLRLDPEKLYWSTRLINSDKFGRFVLVLKRLEHKAFEAKNNMALPRAVNIAEGILASVKAYKYSIDAKSSETLRDKNNSQSSLLHLLGKNKSERKITVAGQGKKTFMDGLVGRSGEEERDEL